MTSLQVSDERTIRLHLACHELAAALNLSEERIHELLAEQDPESVWALLLYDVEGLAS